MPYIFRQSGGWDIVLIRKKEITELSESIRKCIDGEKVDFRDNREGSISVLKNDIHTLVSQKDEQMQVALKEHEMLSQCLSDISHQLKKPITSMRIMTDLLPDAPPDKQEEFISNLNTSLTRMEWLVSSLLKIAKLDSNTVSFSMGTYTARELCEAAAEPLKILLDIKNQTVTCIDLQIIFCCDKRWTIEALTNLLKNASEVSPKNSIIKVACRTNPIYSAIAVTDCGAGIKRENMCRLFKRFENSGNESGYGIGLPLALSIMKGQNGDIEVDGGGNGQGATFTLKFFK